jgi:PAS domain S-box-containing protein
MTLKQAETIAKWIAAITAIFIAARFVWQNLVKAYKYLQESNERKEMLDHILANQAYNIVVNKAIMNKFGLGYFRADTNGYTIEVGDVVCKMLGYREEEIMGLNWCIKIIEEDRPHVMKAFEDSVKYKTDFETVYTIVCGDGTLKKVNAHAKHTNTDYFGVITEIK